MNSELNSFESILNYLREPTTTTPITKKKQRKITNGKELISSENQLNTPKGRVRYGPITVNPRKQPSKTLFTGRRSKYEVLSADEEEKRRDRRERNRIAATKCREKRENVLSHLEEEYRIVLNRNEELSQLVEQLKQRRTELQKETSNHSDQCFLLNNSSSMIFGNSGFLSSIIETTPPPPPLPTTEEENSQKKSEEESNQILDTSFLLTNSDFSNPNFCPLIPPSSSIQMTSLSIELLINSLKSPALSLNDDWNNNNTNNNNNNNNQSFLCNSAQGASCAKQFTSSSDDDSLPSSKTNRCIC